VFGHVSLAPLLFIPTTRDSKTCVFAYGIEVWHSPGRIAEQALLRADSVMAISEYTRRELLKQVRVNPHKVNLFPCSLDPHWVPEELDCESPGGVPVILSVCRLTKDDSYKGVDSVIRSLPAVVRECGPVAYRIVGQGDDVYSLKELAEELNVSSYVTFAGELSEDELREEYRRCSLFVMPSEKEGFGIVFLEAMAHAKPVIGGAHGGTPSVITHGETGLLVSRLDIDELSQSITRILKDSEFRALLGLAGHKRLLDDFTFRGFEANLDSLLQRLTGYR
jgi:glycosyltransferase involved in cell wall biosynthesis